MTDVDAFKKYSFFPIQHDNLLKYYRLQFDMIWTAQEIDMSQDELCTTVSENTGVDLDDVKKVLDAFIQSNLIDMKLK